VRGLTEEQEKPATRLVVNADKFRALMAAKGFRNVEDIAERAREMERPIAFTTIYSVLANGNFTRKSLERLAEVVGVDIDEFVTFEPVPESEDDAGG
jgi:hypothetical protein